MKTIIFNCDICGKEFPPQEYSFLNGIIVKVDAELKPHSGTFEGHYCGEDTHKILEFIEKLTSETNGKHSNTSPVVEPPVEGATNSGA